MNEYPINRRRFLMQASLGATGLALTSSSIFATQNPGTKQTLPADKSSPYGDLNFEPVRYRPMAVKVMGLRRRSIITLDGAWLIHPNSGQNVREQPLDATNWNHFQVPGQWAQQGYDIPRDKVAVLAKEVTIPARWAGYRIFLRFEAI